MKVHDGVAIDVEFYEPHEVRLNDVCVITLFRRVSIETFYESESYVNKFKQDEDLFLSWLSSIASSKGYQLAKAVLKADGVTLEILHANIRAKNTISFPRLSRIRRAYVVPKLKQLNEGVEGAEGADLLPKAVNMVLLRDFSNDELYVFNSPLSILDTTKGEALVLETDDGVVLIRFNEVISKTGTGAEHKRRKKGRGRRSRRSKKKRKERVRG